MMCDDDMEAAIVEMVSVQKEKLMHIARRIVPGVTDDDVLQPQDFLDLETNPEFRYEEGVLQGMETVLAAMRARSK